MGTNNVDKLKAQLRALGFDSRIDEKLNTYLSYDLSKFHLEYEDHYNDNRIMYYIQFSKAHQGGAYKIPHYIAFLERNVPIFHDILNGVNIGALELKLSTFDWRGYTGQRDQHAHVESFRNDLTILSQTELGNKIVQLLIAKCWPSHMPVAERNENLSFDAFTNTYSLRKKVSAEEMITAQETYQFLKKEMDKFSDLKMVHSYAVVIEVEMAKTGTYLMGRTGETYDSIAGAFTRMENIDYRLFDKDFIIKNKLLCQIKILSIIDTQDNCVIASKKIETATDPENSKKQVAISYDVNEQKIKMEDFVRSVNLNSNNSMKTQSLEEIRHLLSFFKPSLPRNQLKKTPDVKVKPSERKGRRLR